MQICLQYQHSYLESKEDLNSKIINIIKKQKKESEPEFLIRIQKAKEKIIKQMPNMYRNTRVLRYLIQNYSTPYEIEYRRIKGLILNIQKRFAWYTKLDKEGVSISLLSLKTRTADIDLKDEERLKYFFNYYAKLTFEYENQRQFISIPLVDLNLIVI